MINDVKHATRIVVILFNLSRRVLSQLAQHIIMESNNMYFVAAYNRL